MALNDYVSELDLEEQLFAAVVHGCPEDHQGLLVSLGDVNVRNGSQRTALHVAVMVGRYDWVEGLLRRGADPFIRDGKDATVLEVAKGMVSKYPEDENRMKIVKLLTFVGERESARESAREGGLSGLCGESFIDAKPEIVLAPQEVMSAMSGLSQEMSSVNGSVAKLQEEVGELRMLMAGAVNEITFGLTARDMLLEKLEASITSLAAEWLSLKESMNGMSGKGKEVRGELGGVSQSCLRNILSVIADDEGEIHTQCIEVMLSRTEFLRRNDEYISRVRSFYQQLYSMGPLTSWILRYLQYQPEVQIVVDCESYYISYIKCEIKDFAGRESGGSSHYAFADFKGKVLYLGGRVSSSWPVERVIGQFVMSLAQMAVFLAFKNEGRPYAVGDEEHSSQYKKALEEVKEGWSVEDSEFDKGIRKLVQSENELEKEICMVAAVPGMIATFGSLDGTLRAHRKMRLLTRYYEDHVVATLSREAKEPSSS